MQPTLPRDNFNVYFYDIDIVADVQSIKKNGCGRSHSRSMIVTAATESNNETISLTAEIRFQKTLETGQNNSYYFVLIQLEMKSTRI